jgi:TolB-like protein
MLIQYQSIFNKSMMFPVSLLTSILQKRNTVMSNRLAIILSGLFVSFYISVQAQQIDSSADKLNVAVLTLKNADGVTAGEVEIISDRLCVELFNTGNINIMERSEMKSLLAEQGFQQSGVCTDEKCMVEIGRILGVQRIVAGSIGKVGSLYLVNLRLIDVSTGRVFRVISRDLNGMDIIVSNLAGISRELVGTSTANAPIEPASNPEDVVVGDNVGTGQQTAPVPAPVPITKSTPEPQYDPPKTQDSRSVVIGIRISGCSFIGETVLNLPDRTPPVLFSSGFNTVTSGPVIIPNIKLVVLIQRYLSVDAGVGYGIWQQKDSVLLSTIAYCQTEHFTMLTLTGGIGISIPVSILRFNAGIHLGYNRLNNNEKTNISGAATSALYQVKTNVGTPSFGGRVGVEIFPIRHFAINLDLRYMYTKFNTATMNYDAAVWPSGAQTQEKLGIELPRVGGELGFSYYF